MNKETRMPNTPNITSLVQAFARQIATAVEASAVERIQAALTGAFGAPQKRGPGRPRKQAAAPALPKAAKKKRPKQLCPVPGCKNPAAPVFGMVCANHKNVAKAKIRKYRAARKAKAAPATAAKPTLVKKVKKATPKVARARKLQGQYLGALKSLTGDNRAKVKALAKDKGVAEAVKLALSLKKKA
jgi:hypothetical protein